MENKMRDEFIKWHTYAHGWEITKPMHFDDLRVKMLFECFQAGYQAGRNHPIEVSLEEAQAALIKAYTTFGGAKFPAVQMTEAVLSLVPNCVVKP